ncbi:MAG TPA: LytTR family DNA-binding domain-containing protein [Burkholderiaceae bacterium]|nr:LytTR family DNA-binding domain-containing protein [Burkholderiaceae bacterium]
MRAPTAVVADDEPMLRAQLVDSLASLWPELRIVGEAAHGEEAVRAVAGERPDIAFLDIEMPGLNGLQAAAQVKGLAHVVFITAYHQYAVEAFERGAIDYVLKPASEARLRETVERLKQRIGQPLPSDEAMRSILARLASVLGKSDPTRLRWIQASVGTQIRLIPIEDVLFFQSDLKYTRVVTRDGESLIRKTLKELLEELDPATFWQVHRATIVNSAAIAHVVREDDRMTITLRHGSARLDVSRTFAHLFKSM